MNPNARLTSQTFPGQVDDYHHSSPYLTYPRQFGMFTKKTRVSMDKEAQDGNISPRSSMLHGLSG